MLARFQRLNIRQFDLVIKNGSVFNTSIFLLRILPKQTDLRIAAVAPTKIAKKANQRNLIRRQIYGAIREIIQSAPRNCHIIIIAKSQFLSAKQPQIKSELKGVFEKIK